MATSQSRFWMSFQVGCTYIGTVVGAGFASGQEIFQFFGRYGNWGYSAIGISIALFAWLGYKVMWLGHRLKARSYHELNRYLFGETIGPIFDIILIVMLFGVTVAMIAGAGALFQERLSISFQWGAMATVIITFLTIARGMKGIFAANSIIVPMMVSFVLYASFHAVRTRGWHHIWSVGHTLQVHHPLVTLCSGVIYSAFNIGLSAGVLIPVGSEIQDIRVLRVGAGIGAAGLGAMLVAVVFALYAHYPTATMLAIPMAYVASQLGPVLQWLFLFVLWGEIYSTLVGNVWSIGAQFGIHSKDRFVFLTAAVLVVAYACSQVGFSTMVAYVYSVFGWISTVIVLALIWPRHRLPAA